MVKKSVKNLIRFENRFFFKYFFREKKTNKNLKINIINKKTYIHRKEEIINNAYRNCQSHAFQRDRVVILEYLGVLKMHREMNAFADDPVNRLNHPDDPCHRDQMQLYHYYLNLRQYFVPAVSPNQDEKIVSRILEK